MNAELPASGWSTMAKSVVPLALTVESRGSEKNKESLELSLQEVTMMIQNDKVVPLIVTSQTEMMTMVDSSDDSPPEWWPSYWKRAYRMEGDIGENILRQHRGSLLKMSGHPLGVVTQDEPEDVFQPVRHCDNCHRKTALDDLVVFFNKRHPNIPMEKILICEGCFESVSEKVAEKVVVDKMIEGRFGDVSR